MPIGNRPPTGAVAGPSLAPQAGPVIQEPPHSTPPAVAVTIEAWRAETLQVVADGTNNPVAELPAAPAGRVLLIDRMAFFTTSGAATYAIVYTGPSLFEGIHFESNGNQAAAGFAPAIVVPTAGTLRVAWTGAGGPPPLAGVRCFARVQYRIAVLTAGGADRA